MFLAQKGKWIVFEKIFKCNPQTATSYAAYIDRDYLRKYLRKNLGLKSYPQQEVLFIYENGNIDWCYNVLNLERLVEKIFQKTIKEPEWGIRNNLEIERRSNELFKIGKNIFRTNIKKLSNRQLNNLYQKYYTRYLNMHVSGWYGNLADYNSIFQNYLTEYLKKKIKKNRLQQSTQEIFFILTTPSKLSNAQQEELIFLFILNKIIKSSKIKKLFQRVSSKRILKVLPKTNSKIDNLLTRHVLRYGWLSYSFEGPGLDKEYFIKKLKKTVIEKVDFRKAIKEIYRFKKIDKIQKKIILKLKIDKKHQDLFRVFTDIMFLKGYRKDSMFFGCYARDQILKEIAVRLNIPIKFLRYVYPWEMKESILDKRVSLKLLQKKFKYHVYFYQEGQRSKILVGSQARAFVKKLKWRKTEIQKTDKIKGMCASPGKARGKVSIINLVEDMRKMKEGNILVSEATSPDLVPAIRKASAIVTNVGGITCHAAIISREMKKPCIIGTKIATKVLKNGDLVKVDADRGIVKIIKRG